MKSVEECSASTTELQWNCHHSRNGGQNVWCTAQHNRRHFHWSLFLVQQLSALQVAEDLAELLPENIIIQLKTMGRKIPPLVSWSGLLIWSFMGSYSPVNPCSVQTIQWVCFKVIGFISPWGHIPSYLHPIMLNGRKPAQQRMENSRSNIVSL